MYILGLQFQVGRVSDGGVIPLANLHLLIFHKQQPTGEQHSNDWDLWEYPTQTTIVFNILRWSSFNTSLYVWLKLLSHLLALELTAIETENSETLIETDLLLQISVLFVSPLPVLLGDSPFTN